MGCAPARPALFLAILLSLPAILHAQQATPHIGYAYPAGGRQGTTFQVSLGGQFLDGVTNVFVSGSGVQAAVLEHTKPLTQQQFNALRDKLRELQEKRAAAVPARRRGQSGSTNVWTAADEKLFNETRQKLTKFAPRRNANPAIAETVFLRVTLSTNAEPGQREIRLGTLANLSNPMSFCVSQLPEFTKRDAKITDDPTPVRQLRNNAEQRATPPTEMNITIPAVVNGQIMPGGVDRYKFTARKGQRLVFTASARELIPYLADAVPGWFQATLALFDAKGNELQFADHFQFHPDPVLFCEIPKDGEYAVQIRDSIFRGREDFVYRITVGELPLVTSIFPLGAQIGHPAPVQISGWNLTNTTFTPELKNLGPGIVSLPLPGENRLAGSIPFALDTLPDCLEREPNDSIANAQPVTLPIIINGRIDKPGDADIFRFEGRAGDELVAEVLARRLNSPLDSILKLTDASGKQLALNDDFEDKGAGLQTHYADSALRIILPAAGTYYVHLSDAQRQGGAEFGYRLRLSSPQPDFALRIVPSTINVRSGASVPITVYALRKDGFTNDISLALNDAPTGFSLSGAHVPANQDQVRLTLSAPFRPLDEPINLSLEGRALIQDRQIIHPAVPAEDMMQAFAYHHLVPAQELKVAVTGGGRSLGRPAVRILGSMPVKIPAGGTARVQLGTPTGGFADRFQLELSEPPEGIAIQDLTASRDGTELVLRSDAAKAKPGLKGNLIVDVFLGKNMAAAQKGKKQGNQRRPPLGTLPAIPFEIVGP